MKRVRHPWLAIALASLHLLLTTVGEALHFLPGMGHYEQMPCGVCLWLGAGHDDMPSCEDLPVDSEHAAIARGHGQDTDEILGEDECPICHLVSMAYARNAAVCWLSPLTLCGEAHAVLPPVVALSTVTHCDARAPPARNPA